MINNSLDMILIIGSIYLLYLLVLGVFSYRRPLHNTIRVLLGVLGLLVASVLVPTIEGKGQLSLDWGWFLKLESEVVTIKIGSPSTHYIYTLGGVVTLLVLCLLRINK